MVQMKYCFNFNFFYYPLLDTYFEFILIDATYFYFILENSLILLWNRY